ncbi:hypothetical protein MKS78_05895 [Acinetobacter baumannii]
MKENEEYKRDGKKLLDKDLKMVQLKFGRLNKKLKTFNRRYKKSKFRENYNCAYINHTEIKNTQKINLEKFAEILRKRAKEKVNINVQSM